MKTGKIILNTRFLAIFLISLLSVVLTAAGIYLLQSRTPLYYVALGDSLAQGYPYYLEKKPLGYTDLISAHLRNAEEFDVVHTNLGISGYTSTDLLNLLSDEQVVPKISRADIITVNIGGNDMLRALGKDGNNYASVLDSISIYSDNLIQIFAKIRSLNPDAHIYIANIFNPTVQDDEDINHTASEKLVSYINKLILEVTGPYNVKVIDISNVFTGHEYGTSHSWFHDRIHPNHLGYSKMSKPFIDAIHQDLESENLLVKLKRLSKDYLPYNTQSSEGFQNPAVE